MRSGTRPRVTSRSFQRFSRCLPFYVADDRDGADFPDMVRDDGDRMPRGRAYQEMFVA